MKYADRILRFAAAVGGEFRWQKLCEQFGPHEWPRHSLERLVKGGVVRRLGWGRYRLT